MMNKSCKNLFILYLFCAIMLSFSGCSKTTQTEILNRVCVKGPFGGTNLEECDTVIQHDSRFDVLHIGSNQIFTMQTEKTISIYYEVQ